MEDFLKSYKKTIQDVRQEYPNFKVYGDTWIFSIYGHILEEQIINEFITKTIDINKTVEELGKRFNIKVKQEKNFIKIYFDKGINMLFKNQFHIINDVNIFMETFGWIPSKIDGFPFKEKTLSNKINNQTQLNIFYEPKFDLKVDVNRYYYHLTPDIYWKNKIENDGLTPKNKSKISFHPERIYLIEKYNKEEFEKLTKRLFLNISNPKVKQMINKYYVLQIDMNALIKSGRDKFYQDPHYSLGIWTYENIPPVYIKVIDEIPLENLTQYI